MIEIGTCSKCGETIISSYKKCVVCRAEPINKRLKELGWEHGVRYVDGLPVGVKYAYNE
jgi:hypothetical protein